MNQDDKWLKKELEKVSREQEDEAWAKKRAEYGEKFDSKKFYELDRFWPNFWSWFPYLTMIAIAVYFLFPSFINEIKEADERAYQMKQRRIVGFIK